jgi:hypothetical protein
MKRLLLLLAILLAPAIASAQAVGPSGPACNKSFQVSQAATILTKVVSGVANQSISLCGWSANSGGAASTWQLQYGTGTNCGTGGTAITPVYSLAINGVQIDHQGSAFISLAGGAAPADLCLVTTGTGPLQIMIYYSQQ